MAAFESKSFDNPDETTTFPKGKVDLLHLSTGTVGKSVFEPGWRWSEHIKPIVRTEWCQQLHVGYQISGRLHIKMASGEEMEFGPGEVAVIQPGHDGWVVGDEPCVGIDWTGMATYAKP
jgi:hypothetical protein